MQGIGRRVRGFSGRAGRDAGGPDAVDAKLATEVGSLLADTLGLGSEPLDPSTRLLGHMVELDSMAVVAIITALEERYGFVVQDYELSASVFDSVESLTQFVAGKLRP